MSNYISHKHSRFLRLKGHLFSLPHFLAKHVNLMPHQVKKLETELSELKAKLRAEEQKSNEQQEVCF